MIALPKIPVFMSVTDFLAWCPPGDTAWQLVDGEPRAMAPASRTHGALQAELGSALRNHLVQQGSRCSVLIAPGIIPRVQATHNVRIPDLAVSCSSYQTEEAALTDPVLIVEILSPSNAAETWSNVWTYTTIPSVREILILRTTEIGADLLRRQPDGLWPEQPAELRCGTLTLESVDFTCELRALYRTTRLAAQ